MRDGLASVHCVSRNRLGSVTAAAAVLKSFTSSKADWGVTELAAHLDMSRSTVHRILATLADERILEQDPGTQRYRPGLVFYDLAAATPTQRSLHEAVLLPLSALRSKTGETVQVAVLDGREVVYVERLDSPQSLRIFAAVGRRNAAHCTATGKVLLAYAPRARRDRLLRGWELTPKTEHTIIDIDELRRELNAVRRRGYATNQHESELGVVSVAAPIRDGQRETVAAISVAGPSDRLDQRHDAIVEAVQQIAAAASRRLGFTGKVDKGDADAAL